MTFNATPSDILSNRAESIQVPPATPYHSQAPSALGQPCREVWGRWRRLPPPPPHLTSCARRAAAPGVLKRDRGNSWKEKRVSRGHLALRQGRCPCTP